VTGANAILLLAASTAHHEVTWYEWLSIGAGVVSSVVALASTALRSIASGLFRRTSGTNTVIVRSGRNKTVVSADRVQASDIERIVNEAERQWHSDSGAES
jgi:hypothetical protein